MVPILCLLLVKQKQDNINLFIISKKELQNTSILNLWKQKYMA